jgi:hypothetical protein
MLLPLQGEVWPNRCSEAIDEANTRIQGLTEGSDHLHFLDIGQVISCLAAYTLSPCSFCKGVKCTVFMTTLLHKIYSDASEMPEWLHICKCQEHYRPPCHLAFCLEKRPEYL